MDQRVGAVDPDLFENTLNYLRSLGYRFISLENLMNGILESRQERVAVITFDDGFKDLYENAYPICRRLNIPFTLFLTTCNIGSEKLLWLHKLYISIEKLPYMSKVNILKKYIDLQDDDEDLNRIISKIIISKERNVIENLASSMASEAELSIEKERVIARELYLTKSELFEMEKHGLAIEVHGHEHWSLANLTRSEMEEEIRNSVEYIIRELNRKPSFYCLPYGMGNQFVEDIVKDLGLVGICTTEARLVNAFEDTLSLPRFCVGNDISMFYGQIARGYVKAFLESINWKRTS